MRRFLKIGKIQLALLQFQLVSNKFVSFEPSLGSFRFMTLHTFNFFPAALSITIFLFVLWNIFRIFFFFILIFYNFSLLFCYSFIENIISTYIQKHLLN